MVADDNWTNQEAGIDCYLCPPRVSAPTALVLVERLSVSSLYLEKDQRFLGLSSLILTDHATRLNALSQAAYIAYVEDLITTSSKASVSTCDRISMFA
jgi:hypothetical protein